ncbi:uncharacterized protein LOC106150557 [Lingula anatina]|uniref:Uncharacterized protein LOC106150557 n=1 Tax=Lingula anatina TaxID=7574 RepID=A0A1S3H079_LINAN|nr:uncharacterized protein LOC106150557 [Lingula anatina]|eukprot:XP_013378886.1 uncharacterized protein LOC106150557 [Lingula anatina]
MYRLLFLLVACSVVILVSSREKARLMPIPKQCNLDPITDLDLSKFNGIWWELVVTLLSTHDESRYLQDGRLNVTYLDENSGGPGLRMRRFRSWSNENTCDEFDFNYFQTEQPGVLVATKDDGTIMYYKTIVETNGHSVLCRQYYPELGESTYHLWSQHLCFSPSDVATLLNRISSDPCMREQKYVAMEHTGVCGMPPNASWSEILE